MTKNLTIKEFSEIIQQDYLTTTALVKLMVSVGAAKEIGNRKIDGQKGKPSKVYEIEKDFDLEFWQENEPVETVAVVETNEVAPVTETVVS